jgi:cytochrome P450
MVRAFTSPSRISHSLSFCRTILHDPEVFPDPLTFNPDRFLNNDSHETNISPLHPLSSAFGYGRRACPGRYMAEQQLFITVATILALFEIGPGLDEKGSPVRAEARFTSGMIWCVHAYLPRLELKSEGC